MANDFYAPTSAPASNSALSSATIRNEFTLIKEGFDKLPDLTGNASLPVFVNAGATAQEAVSAASARTKLGLVIGTNVQAYDVNLPTWPATVDATEVGYLNGVTSAIQTQLNNKQALDVNLPTWPATVDATEVSYLNGVTSNIQTQITLAAQNGEAARHNLLINSNFGPNQDAYAADGAASVAAGAYGHDMWKAAVSGGSVIYRKETNGDITIVSFTQSGVGDANLYQKNDELIAAEGKSVTVSFEVVSLDEDIKMRLVGAADQTITTAGAYSFTTVADASGAFSFRHTFAGAGTYTPNFRFRNLKIEYGSNATEYEIPEPRAEESRCYFYYWKPGYAFHLSATTVASNPEAFAGFVLPHQMRIVPAVTPTAAGSHTIVNIEGVVAGALDVFNGNSSIVYLEFTRSVGNFTDARPASLMMHSSTAFNARY